MRVQEFELERSALAALLLTEREDTRVLTREYHFKAETLRVFWCKHWQTAQVTFAKVPLQNHCK